MLDRRVLAQLFVGAVIFALFLWSLAPASWEKQFKATGKALQNAHSFNLTITRKHPRGGTVESTSDVNCPDDFHSLEHHIGADGTVIPEEDLEMWSEGSTHIQRQNLRLIDVKVKLRAPNCGSRMLLEVPPMMNYDVIYMRGHGVRGSKKSIEGKSCREWTIQMPQGNGWGDLYTMCVDENNLPLEVVAKDGSMVAHASHWNEKIPLPPTPELPPPNPAEYGTTTVINSN